MPDGSNYHDFFDGSRPKLELDNWQPLLSENSEKRVRLDLLMPLTGLTSGSIPYWVRPSYERMDVEDSPVKDVDLNVELEGFTLECFSTDSSQHPIETESHGIEVSKKELGRRHVLLPGSTLRNFKIVRVTRDKQSLVCLKFSITTKSDGALVLWAHKYHGSSFFGQFTKSDTELDLSTKKDDGKQMKLTDAAPAVEQTATEAEANAKKFLKGKGKQTSTPVEKQEAAGVCNFGGYCAQPVFHKGDHDANPSDAAVDAELKNKGKRKSAPKTREDNVREKFGKRTNASVN